MRKIVLMFIFCCFFQAAFSQQEWNGMPVNRLSANGKKEGLWIEKDGLYTSYKQYHNGIMDGPFLDYCSEETYDFHYMSNGKTAWSCLCVFHKPDVYPLLLSFDFNYHNTVPKPKCAGYTENKPFPNSCCEMSFHSNGRIMDVVRDQFYDIAECTFYGKRLVYDEDGNLVEIECFGDEYVKLHPGADGWEECVGTFKNDCNGTPVNRLNSSGNKEGWWVTDTLGFRQSIAMYKNGVRNGFFMEFSPTSHALTEFGTMKNGKYAGALVLLDHGKIASIYMDIKKNTCPTPACYKVQDLSKRMWCYQLLLHPNGKIASEGQLLFDDDLRTDNIRVGQWREYDESGNLLKITKYGDKQVELPPCEYGWKEQIYTLEKEVEKLKICTFPRHLPSCPVIARE